MPRANQPRSFSSAGSSLLVLCLFLCGCPEKRPGVTAVFANRPAKPAGHSEQPKASFAPFAGGSAPSGEVESGVELPLPLTGHNSLASMKDDLSRLPAADQKSYERAYRLTLTPDRTKRRRDEARSLLSDILSKHQNFGPAYRIMGYTYIDDGFNVNEAANWYRRSIDKDPSYGLAHYGLAFILAPAGQVEEGYKHFQKAMALGVPDERSLGSRFFKGMQEGIRSH